MFRLWNDLSNIVLYLWSSYSFWIVEKFLLHKFLYYEKLNWWYTEGPIRWNSSPIVMKLTHTKKWRLIKCWLQNVLWIYEVTRNMIFTDDAEDCLHESTLRWLNIASLLSACDVSWISWIVFMGVDARCQNCLVFCSHAVRFSSVGAPSCLGVWPMSGKHILRVEFFSNFTFYF